MIEHPDHGHGSSSVLHVDVQVELLNSIQAEPAGYDHLYFNMNVNSIISYNWRCHGVTLLLTRETSTSSYSIHLLGDKVHSGPTRGNLSKSLNFFNFWTRALEMFKGCQCYYMEVTKYYIIGIPMSRWNTGGTMSISLTSPPKKYCHTRKRRTVHQSRVA